MIVEQSIIDRLVALAQARPEREVCGALLGDGERIVGFEPIENRSPAPEHGYFISAAEVYRLERTGGLAGFYHSHPSGGATPSARDLEHALPGYIYLIIPATGTPRARAWRLREDRTAFDEVARFGSDDD